MLIHIKNEHLSTQYPLIHLALSSGNSELNGITYFDKETGHEYSAIKLESLDQLTALVSLAKATNEYCTGIFFDGNTITISEKAYTLGE